MYTGGLSAADGGLVSPAVGTAAPHETLDSGADTDFAARSDALAVEMVRFGDHATPRSRWLARYQGALVAVDAAAVAFAAILAFALRFNADLTRPQMTADIALVIILPPAWVGFIALNRAYEGRYVGVGSAEFERVFRAFLHLTALTAVLLWVSDVRVARGFVIPALCLALGFDLVGRYGARRFLHARRADGRAMTTVVAVGNAAAVAGFTAMVRRDTHAGLQVVGACVPRAGDPMEIADLDKIDVPVLGDVDSIRAAVTRHGAQAVAVVSGELGSEKLRWISWQLEGSETSLLVSPGMAEIGGRRLHVQPVAGLPLLHVDQPEFVGFRRMLKNAFDRAAALAGLIVLAPLLLGIAGVVRCTSRGPALFRQTRVGLNGREFTMVKFRSMVSDAEERLEALAERNETGGPLFKIRRDPRVTRVGQVLRRFSLDELPQLINVLSGSMSLVGPRPPLPSEVATYADEVRRRLLVKPGLTGLWQISGRSDLTWEESVRLDLRYVEDWSFALDMQVLWKTARAVIRSEGAY